MSLSETLTQSRKLGVVLAVMATAALAGCADSTGFRPLYGNAGVMNSVDAKLASVEMATIPGRVGQRVRNELLFQTAGGDGATAAPVYRLEVVLRESLLSTLVERDGDSLSQVYSLDASFRLINIADNRVILSGTSFGRAGFERFTSVLANVRAKEDAENRAAKTVATDIRGRVAAYLSRPA
jgi:LPS-assembly lipoprotein